VVPTALEYSPAAQSVHAAFPVSILYVPATHSVHGPQIGPVDPALQVQAVEAVLCTGEVESGGQILQEKNCTFFIS